MRREENIKRTKRHISLRKKIICVYFLISVIPTILITTIANGLYGRNYLKQANSLVDQNAQQYEIIINERLKQYEKLLYEMVIDKEYIDLANKIDQGDENAILIDRNHMEKILANFVYTYDAIRSVVFISNSNRYVSYSKWYGTSHEVIWSDEDERKAIHDEIAKQEGLTFLGMVNQSNSTRKDDYVILMGFPVKNLRTKQQSGELMIALDDSIFLFAENHVNPTEVSTILVDAQNHILSGTTNEYINSDLTEYIENVFHGKKISIRKTDMENTNWQIVNIIDEELQRKSTREFASIVILITVGITITFFIIIFLISRRYISEIERIAQGMKNYTGTQDENAEIVWEEQDELYVIVRQYNSMIRRINELVKTLQKRNEEIKVAALNQKHAEIKALEAQINPHFLYNTLDSINWRAIENDEEEISDMLGALGSLLRYSVSNIDAVVILRAEIDWLKKYVYLQRDRFQNSFDCFYEVTEEAMGFPIYKMLLQPIIENIILHAFEDVKQGGIINVKAYIQDDAFLNISISDNGCGMDEETVRFIREELSKNGMLNSRSIGISNVIHRLKLYYHDDAKIEVTSKQGVGTEFVLIIPPYHYDQ